MVVDLLEIRFTCFGSSKFTDIRSPKLITTKIQSLSAQFYSQVHLSIFIRNFSESLAFTSLVVLKTQRWFEEMEKEFQFWNISTGKTELP